MQRDHTGERIAFQRESEHAVDVRQPGDPARDPATEVLGRRDGSEPGGSPALSLVAETLRADILRHLEDLALPSFVAAGRAGSLTKERIRAMHALQRSAYLRREWRALAHNCARLATFFADGTEVRPDAIDPELVPVHSECETGDLFRFATLFWSVPVSRGFGRRLRYLVRDRSNGKLIGLFALGDPVFNLRARDQWIGWTVEGRRQRLVHVMDAYVLGAVPPYAQLLGGKLVAALIGSREVSEAFTNRYGRLPGIISGTVKQARLVLVTVTSALGRSSLYNRLKLTAPAADGTQQVLVEYLRIGTTAGYGHFQLSEELFRRLRDLLIQEGHHYASGYQYGQGPNWRMRVIRVGLEMLGLDPGRLQYHGIPREVYALPLARNTRAFLCGSDPEPVLERPCAAEIAQAARQRWILPRAARDPAYRDVRREEILAGLQRALRQAGATE